ncbi:hypothetical protein M0P25_04230 [archaeon]|nr:hypothetical protein [Acholeplasmataceae bacterium]MCK9293256.1 hypothetical protein [archaeon]MCK9439461.1 hypothetical protein [Patescibacteria group bacterium]
MSILISFVGNHDPIGNEQDGPVLHIIRHYNPKKVYLLLSDRMDNEITKINMINGINSVIKNKKSGEEIVEFVSLNVANPAMFTDFSLSEVINKIVDKHDKGNIIYNISSGTPQMQSALILDLVLYNRKGLFLQVSSPYPNQKPINLIPLVDFENNLDILDEAKNRINKSQIYSFKINQIKNELINKTKAYSYKFLFELINEYKETYLKNHSKLISLIEYAYNCDVLNEIPNQVVNKIIVDDKRLCRFTRYNRNDLATVSIIINYYLALENELKRGHFIDVMLRTKPLFYELLKHLLLYGLEANKININEKPWRRLNRYNKLNINEIKEYDRNLLGLETIKQINWELMLDTRHLIDLLNYYGLTEFKKEIAIIRDKEEEIRNKLAHDIKNNIKNKEVKLAAETTFKNLTTIIKATFKNFSNDINYNFFNDLNDLIIKKIKNITEKEDENG